MNSKVEHSKAAASAGDLARYALALLLVVAGVFAFYWFGQWPAALRALAVIAGLAAGAIVFLTSGKGRDTREFLSESGFELRKVVWPTLQETRRTTVVVMIVVLVISLLLAAFDAVIRVVVTWLLGH